MASSSTTASIPMNTAASAIKAVGQVITVSSGPLGFVDGRPFARAISP